MAVLFELEWNPHPEFTIAWPHSSNISRPPRGDLTFYQTQDTPPRFKHIREQYHSPSFLLS